MVMLADRLATQKIVRACTLFSLAEGQIPDRWVNLQERQRTDEQEEKEGRAPQGQRRQPRLRGRSIQDRRQAARQHVTWLMQADCMNELQGTYSSTQ